MWEREEESRGRGCEDRKLDRMPAKSTCQTEEPAALCHTTRAWHALFTFSLLFTPSLSPSLSPSLYLPTFLSVERDRDTVEVEPQRPLLPALLFTQNTGSVVSMATGSLPPLCPAACFFFIQSLFIGCQERSVTHTCKREGSVCRLESGASTDDPQSVNQPPASSLHQYLLACEEGGQGLDFSSQCVL